MIQLIDAVHILSSDSISMINLERAEQLLFSFVDNFELLYGETNTVFNVHIARHLADCVRSIGPLSTYSNYCFEDHIGHLVSLQKGTTDVATQICEKYLLEKNLFQSIENSTIAKEFYEEINGKHKFSITRRVEGSIVIGNPKKPSQLTDEERYLIINYLNIPFDAQIDEYSSVLLNSRIFFETINCTKKRTNDTFVLNRSSRKFGDIKSIFVVNEKLYFLINEKYAELSDRENCQNIRFLSLTDSMNQRLIESKFVGPKYALIKFDQTIACAKFPNLYERN